VERLPAEADAVDPVGREDGDAVFRERVGVGLDGVLASRLEGEVPRDQREQPLELRRPEVRRGAAAEEDRADRMPAGRPGQFGGQRGEVVIDAVVLARGDGEVAVAAVVFAERYVDVSGPWPEPGGGVSQIGGGRCEDLTPPAPPGAGGGGLGLRPHGERRSRHSGAAPASLIVEAGSLLKTLFAGGALVLAQSASWFTWETLPRSRSPRPLAWHSRIASWT
jgi:hypothetical protein